MANLNVLGGPMSKLLSACYCPKCNSNNIVIKKKGKIPEPEPISMDALGSRSGPQAIPAVVVLHRWKAICIDCSYSVEWDEGAGL